MNSIIFGATGRTGRLLVEQAKALGHQVTAFARNPDSTLLLNPAIKVIRGDLMDATAVTRAIEGQNVILSAVGVPGSAARAPTTFFSQGIKNIVAGARQAGVRRIICLGSCGIDPETKAFLPLKILGDLIIAPLFLRGIYDDYVRMETWLAEVDLDWTVMRPPLLTDGRLTTRYRTGVGQHLKGIARISRADLAHCVLTKISDVATYRRWVEVASDPERQRDEHSPEYFPYSHKMPRRSREPASMRRISPENLTTDECESILDHVSHAETHPAAICGHPKRAVTALVRISSIATFILSLVPVA